MKKMNSLTLNGTTYNRFAGDVESVNGQTGAVVLNAEDVGALPDTTQIPAVPAALPNPNKLTFTGAVSAEYDGSAAVSVEIPDASDIELDTTLSVKGKAADAKAVGDAVGILGNLSTNNKFNLVAAINELYEMIKSGGGGSATSDEITLVDGVLTIVSLANEPTQSGGVLTIT